MKTKSDKQPEANPTPPKTPTPSAAAPKPPLTPEQIVARAQAGDASMLPLLRKLMDERPEIWEHYGNLSTVIERSLIKRIAGKNLVVSESVARTTEALHQQLGGRTHLEKLMISRIVSASLQVQQAELVLSAEVDEPIRVRQFRLKVLDSAEKRFQAASRNLALVRRLVGGVKMHVQHDHSVRSVPANTPSAPTSASAKKPANSTGAGAVSRDRMEGLFGTAADKLVAAEEKHACSMS